MKLGISEILQETVKQKSKSEKIQFLKKYESESLKKVLSYMYDKTHVSLLPDGAPPYKADNSPEGWGMLYSETRRLRIFFEGNGYDHLDSLKRENLFVSLIESLHPDDAKLVIAMKDHKKIPGITEAIVKEAFPGIITEKKKEKKSGQDVSS